MDKEKEIQELERLLCPYGYEHFSDNACGECPIRCDGDAKKLYNAGYRKAEEVRKDIVIGICADLFRFLFHDNKKQCNTSEAVEFCDKWYVKVGLPPYYESAIEKYKSEVIKDD